MRRCPASRRSTESTTTVPLRLGRPARAGAAGLATADVATSAVREPSLEEIFLAYYGGRRR